MIQVGTAEIPQRASESVEDGGGASGLFDGLPIGVYRTTTDGRLLYANRALVTMLGYGDRAALMKVNAAEIYADAEDRLRWLDLLQREGDGASFEMRDRRSDGSVIWVRDVARAVRDRAGDIVCYEGSLENVTVRREAERYLSESEERFRRLAAVSEDVLWEWDFESGVVRWSHALRTVLGHRPEEVGPAIEQSYRWWRGRIHPDDRERVCLDFHRCIADGQFRWSAEYRFRRADGSYARVYDRCHIARDAKKRPVHLIGSMVDLDRGTAGADESTGAIDTLRPPVPPTPDVRLIEWAAAGDRRAFEELYARHSAGLYAVLLARLDYEADAEELVAETFLQAWRQAASFDPERGTVGSWLTCIGQSRAADRWRKASRRRLLLESSPRGEVVAIEPQGEQLQLEEVEAVLSRLPASQRHAIELAFFGGMSHTEIARRLDAPLGTVKTRIRDGIARMRAEIERCGSAG